MELELKIENGLSGWVLVEAHLDARYGRCFTSLRVRRRSSPGVVEEMPLSIMQDGHLTELVELPGDVSELIWRAPGHGQFDSARIAVRRVGLAERILRMTIRVVRTRLRLPEYQRREAGLTIGRSIVDLAGAYRAATASRIRYPLPDQREHDSLRVRYPLLNYPDWIERFDTLGDRDVAAIRAHLDRFPSRPRFHLLVSDPGEGPAAVAATAASLRAQLYDNFDYTVIDPSAPHSSPPTPHSSPEWIMLLRAGDTLPAHALYWFACETLAQPEATIVYSDDDAVDAAGQRARPRFKPDWSPAHLRATHYIGAAAIFRADAVEKAGGVSAEDCRHGNYDLLLRVVDAAAGGHVCHIPAVLLHRRAPPFESQVTSHESQDSSHKLPDHSGAWEEPGWMIGALRAHLARSNIEAEVSETGPGCRRVRYRLPDPAPRVSIIVPTRDALALVRQCVESVLAKTTYPNYEILVVDNQSALPETLAWFPEIAARPNVRVLRYDRPFNFSAINNFATREARGEILCLLNNDIEVIAPDWLDEMAGHLAQKQVGIVGAKLLYPYGRVQHAGVAVGPGGCADHLHTHLWRDEPGYCNRAVVAQELSAVTGACLLTWKDLYLRLQGLNETDLRVGFNDIDYCLRAQEAGCRVIFTPHAMLAHHESASRGSDAPLLKRLRARREVAYMRARWPERLRCDPYYNPNLSYWRPDFSLAEMQRVNKPWLRE